MDIRETAEAHWAWLKDVLYVSFRTGHISTLPEGKEWDEEVIEANFAKIESLLKKLYVGAFVHGGKHIEAALQSNIDEQQPGAS